MLKKLQKYKNEMFTMDSLLYLSWQILLMFFVYLTLVALCNKEALPPDGNFFHLCTLFLMSHIGGKISYLKLPSLFGMMIAGFIYGNLVKPNLNESLVSAIRSIALMVILLRAGLHLSPEYVRTLSFACIRITVIPFIIETLTVGLCSYLLFQFDFIWAMMIGFVLAAVSPAVVVPCMIRVQQAGLSEGKGIPTLNIAAASIDDVLAVTGFNIFLGFALPQHVTTLAWNLLKGPIEVIIGIVFGIVMGILLWYLPERYDLCEDIKKYHIERFSLFLAIGSFAMFGSSYFEFEGSGPLAILIVSFVATIGWRKNGWEEDNENSLKIIWFISKRFLFCLIGCDLLVENLEMNIVLKAILCIVVGIILKIAVAYVVTYGIGLNRKERLFVAISWLPKATVQAAIGAVALNLAQTDEDKRKGQIILTSAAISIMMTAPLGAIIMDHLYPKLLTKPNTNNNNNILSNVPQEIGIKMPKTSENHHAPTVVLPSGGKIRGKIFIIEDEHKTKVHFYQGIRYGKAERFGKPEMVTSWPEDVYDATKDGNSCHQFLKDDVDLDAFHKTNKSEDCLFLNVWKPISENDKLRPVMVWIYGGGFQSGTIFIPIYEGPRLSAYGDVVVVSINYRLGVLGFSFLGIEGAPGNQAFHDQILGLKWVQENIKSFGGDPNQVTLFGESAGSLSTSILTLSPITKGLFQRAIFQSGSVFPTANFTRDKQYGLMMTKKFGQKLGCHQIDIEKLLNCMKSKPIEEIQKLGKVDMEKMMAGEMVGPIMGDEIYPVDVARLERRFNEVDVMFGVTHDEGSVVLKYWLPVVEDDDHKYTMDEVKQLMKDLMNKNYIFETEDIVEHYTKNLDVNDVNQVRIALGQMYGDFILTCPTILLGEQLAQRSTSKHFYSYRLDRFNSVLSRLWGCKEWMGVCHGVDIFYILGSNTMKQMPVDFKLSYDMIKAWTQFAKTGSPGMMGQTEWLEVYEDPKKPTTPRVMILDKEYKMIDNLFDETCHKIWEPIMSPWHPKYTHHHKQEL